MLDYWIAYGINLCRILVLENRKVTWKVEDYLLKALVDSSWIRAFKFR